VNLEVVFSKQVEVIRWTRENLEREFSFSSRNDRLAFSCFDLAAEHHASIVYLAQGQLYGSAFALLRVEFEALLRGLWLRSAATDKDVDRFMRGVVKKSVAEMLEAAVGRGCDKAALLSHVKALKWSVFNSFTHTGHQALLRRVGPNTTGYENYAEQDIRTCLNHAGLLGCMAASAMAEYTGNEQLVLQSMRLANSYVSASKK